MSRKRRLPGFAWRVLAHRYVDGAYYSSPVEMEYDGSEDVCFDELVIGNGLGGVWFHIEQMSARHWWMCVGDLHLNAHIHPDGRVEVSGWWDGKDEDMPRFMGGAR